MSYYDIYLDRESLKTGKSISLVSPPGFIDQRKGKKQQVERPVKNFELQKLKVKKAWEFAYSPAKNIPMNVIMMYFSPNTLQLIPIMMTLMLFVNPLKDIYSVNDKFDNFDLGESADANYERVMMKVLYVLCSMGTMAVGVWKLNGMGLIPNSSSDWLAWEAPTISNFRTLVI